MGDRITNIFERMKDGEITNLEELHDIVHFALGIKEENFTAANSESNQCYGCKFWYAICTRQVKPGSKSCLKLRSYTAYVSRTVVQIKEKHDITQL